MCIQEKKNYKENTKTIIIFFLDDTVQKPLNQDEYNMTLDKMSSNP